MESKREAMSTENSFWNLQHGALARADVGGHADGDSMGFWDGGSLEKVSHKCAREGIPDADRALHLHGWSFQK